MKMSRQEVKKRFQLKLLSLLTMGIGIWGLLKVVFGVELARTFDTRALLAGSLQVFLIGLATFVLQRQQHK